MAAGSVALMRPWRRLLTDAGLGAILAGLLALPMLGFRLVDSANGLSVSGRPDWVLWAMAVVGGGRLALGLIRQAWPPGGVTLPPVVAALPQRFDAARPQVGWLLMATAFLLPFMPFADHKTIATGTLVLIYIILGWGLNIVVGLAGLLCLGFAAFYAVGAYAYTLIALNFHLSFWLTTPLAGLIAAAFGLALGFPVLRLRGDYLAIVTLGFGEIVRIVLLNWQSLTSGPRGISGIPLPTIPGLSYRPDQRVTFVYFVVLALVLIINVVALRLRRLPIGRAWEALREDEIACRSLGLNPTMLKLSALAVGAACAGIAGACFAIRQGFISPESFTFMESAAILAIVVLGGMGSQIGVVLAALLLVALPEWFRDLQQYRMLAFGGAMVLIMLWKPSGLLSSRSPTIRLGDGA